MVTLLVTTNLYSPTFTQKDTNKQKRENGIKREPEKWTLKGRENFRYVYKYRLDSWVLIACIG